MDFNRIIRRSFWLFICSYLSTSHWVFCCWKSTIVDIHLRNGFSFNFWFKRGFSRVLLEFPKILIFSCATVQSHAPGIMILLFFCLVYKKLRQYYINHLYASEMAYPNIQLINAFVWFVLAQFHQRKAMSQSLYFDIEYSRSYRQRPFLSRKLQWITIRDWRCVNTALV